MDKSTIDQDAFFKATSLLCAVLRAAQDSGIHGETVDVYALAEDYYHEMKKIGNSKPKKEKLKKTKGL